MIICSNKIQKNIVSSKLNYIERLTIYKKILSKMKYLLYYNLDSKFKSDQKNVGGDGTSVVSVVDGVAWTEDAENVYYRLNSEDSAITSYTITVHYRYVSGSSYTSVTQESIYTVNCYSGYSTEVTLFPKQVSEYVPKNESAVLTVSGNITYVFEYEKFDLLQLEYVEVTDFIPKYSGITTNEINSEAEFKLLCCFYLPSISTSETTLISSNRCVFSMIAHNGTTQRITTQRRFTSSTSGKYIEWDTFNGSLNSGWSIYLYLDTQKNQGYGSYVKQEGNLLSPKAVVPYSDFESYSTNDLYRLNKNYTNENNPVLEKITFFHGNCLPGTRFYGAKFYDAADSIIYDYVPAVKNGQYGILEKKSMNFYPHSKLTGA